MKHRTLSIPSILIFSVALLASMPADAQVPPGLTERTTTDFGGRHSIAGTVLLPNGDPPSERIRIRLVSPGRDVSTSTDESGRFLITGLPDGGYTIYVEPPEKYHPQSDNIEISSNRAAAGQTFTVQFRLRESTRTEGKPGVFNADLAGVPKRAVQFYDQGGSKAAAGDTKGAVEALLTAVAEHPEFFLAHAELGVQYQKLSDLEKADHHLRMALKIKPDAFEPLANRGIILVRLRKYADAEPVLRDAIRIREDSPIVQFYLGRSLLGQKKPDKAEAVFKAAFEQGGNEMIEARRALATIYLERGENDKALVEIEAYLAGNPTAYDAKELKDTAAKIKEWLKANPK